MTILAIVGTSTHEHSLRNQVGMGSESDCLLGQFERTLRTSDSEAGLKVEKSEGVVEGEVSVEMTWCGIKGQTKFRYFVGKERSKVVSK